MKRWLLALLVVAGCGKAPEPLVLDARQRARDLLDQKILVDARVARHIQSQQILRMLASREYQKLDQYLDEMQKADPFLSFNTPCSALLRALQEKKETAIYDNLFLNEHLYKKYQATGSPWGQVAGTMACWEETRVFMRSAGFRHGAHYWLGRRAQERLYQALEKVPANHPAWSYLGALRALKGVECEAWGKKLSAYLAQHPQELAVVLDLCWLDADSGLKSPRDWIRADSPQAYATYFLVRSQGGQTFLRQSWDWDTLQKGFEELRKAHPQSAELLNGQALAAWVTEHPEQARELTRQLGYLWENDSWGGVPGYRRWFPDGGDCRHSGSPLAGLPVGAEMGKALWAPMQTLSLQHQVRELLEREEFEVLNFLLEDLRKQDPDRLQEVLLDLDYWGEKKEVAFKAHLERLKHWSEQDPDGVEVRSLLAAFYIDYAWLARGEGYGSSVSEAGWKLFRERLETSKKYCGQAWGMGCRDGFLKRQMMTLLMALDGDKQKAFELAKDSLGKPGWRPVLAGYAYLILPRWLGEEGDLARAADEFRKASGNDDAYVVLGITTLEQEGKDGLQPGCVDFRRLSLAVKDMVKRKALPASWAESYLKQCELLERGREGKAVLESVGADWDLERWIDVYGLAASKAYALGKGKPRKIEQPDLKWTFSKLYWSPPSNGKMVLGQRFGYLAKNPGMASRNLVAAFTVRIVSPGIVADDGTRYRHWEIPIEIYPDEEFVVDCFWQFQYPHEMVPGKWDVELWGDGEWLQSCWFQWE